MDSQTWALVWPPIIAAMIGACAVFWVFARGKDSTAADGLNTRVSSMETKISAMEVKVDTMWQFQLRRAVTESVSMGLATRNSPLKFSEDALAHLNSLKDELITFYNTIPDGTSDADQLLMFETKFGEQLAEQVCIPCKLSHATCLLMAVSVGRQQNPIDFRI